MRRLRDSAGVECKYTGVKCIVAGCPKLWKRNCYFSGMSCRNFDCRSKQFGQFVSGLILRSALLMLFQLSVHASQTVPLVWDSNGDANVAGYKIYFGVASHNYTQWVDVGNVTNATITVPSAGATYYFSATAYDSSGTESDYSNEATFILPAAAALTAVTCSGGQFRFAVTGMPGALYVIEASTNLVAWFPVQTNAAPFTFVDANTAGLSQCFYRAVSP